MSKNTMNSFKFKAWKVYSYKNIPLEQLCNWLSHSRILPHKRFVWIPVGFLSESQFKLEFENYKLTKSDEMIKHTVRSLSSQCDLYFRG